MIRNAVFEAGRGRDSGKTDDPEKNHDDSSYPQIQIWPTKSFFELQNHSIPVQDRSWQVQKSEAWRRQLFLEANMYHDYEEKSGFFGGMFVGSILGPSPDIVRLEKVSFQKQNRRLGNRRAVGVVILMANTYSHKMAHFRASRNQCFRSRCNCNGQP
jgi:hypothetical protein